MIRFKQVLGLFILLQCAESKTRLRRQGDLNEWKIMTTPKSENCYKYCGGSRRFGGPCKACGPGGWCCSHSKMGSCTWKQSNTIKKAGTKGHRCMPPVFTSKPSKLGNKQKPSKKTKLPKHQQPPRLQQRQLQVRLHKSYWRFSFYPLNVSQFSVYK